MLNMNEINEEIKKLENKDYLTYDICNKLAILYTVKNNYKPSQQQPARNNMDLEVSKMPIK